jgi:hypothetical protein
VQHAAHRLKPVFRITCQRAHIHIVRCQLTSLPAPVT